MTKNNNRLINDLLNPSIMVLFALSSFPLSVQAQGEVPSAPMFDDVMLWGEEEKLYGATKYIKHLNQAPANASVITDKQIEAMGAQTLAEVLVTVPGVSIVTTTPYGKRSLMVRGSYNTEGDLVLFTINNYSISHVITGSAGWHFLDMSASNIKRIEVIRGPGSALYGANAAVAVVNIITKNGEDMNYSRVGIGAGNFDKHNYSVVSGRNLDDWNYALMMNHSDKGKSGTNVDSDKFLQSGELDDSLELDEFHASAQFNNIELEYFISKMLRRGYIGADYTLNNESEQKSLQQYFKATYDKYLAENVHLRSTAYYDDWNLDFFYEFYPEGAMDGFPEGVLATVEFGAYSTGIDGQLDISLHDNHTISIGLVYQEMASYNTESKANYDPLTYQPLGEFTSIAPGLPEKRRTIAAAFFQNVYRFSAGVETTLGLRHDRYSDFGETTNPRAAVVWTYDPKTFIKIMYGKAFKAPNYQELYITSNPFLHGNPELDPSIVSTIETSVSHIYTSAAKASITAFYTEYDEVIQLDSNGLYQNSGNDRYQGIELGAQIGEYNASNLEVSYTYTQARDKVTDVDLVYIPVHQAKANMTYRMEAMLSAYLGLRYSSEKERLETDEREDIPAVTVVDTALNWTAGTIPLQLQFAVKNVTDEKYRDPDMSQTLVNDFPYPGRNYLLSVKMRF